MLVADTSASVVLGFRTARRSRRRGIGVSHRRSPVYEGRFLSGSEVEGDHGPIE